jgi:hypothetical protein
MSRSLQFAVVTLLLSTALRAQPSLETKEVEISLSALFFHSSSITSEPGHPDLVWDETFRASQITLSLIVPLSHWFSVTGGFVHASAHHRGPYHIVDMTPIPYGIDHIGTTRKSWGILMGLQFVAPVLSMTYLIVRPQIAFAWTWYSKDDTREWREHVGPILEEPAFCLPMLSIGLKFDVTNRISLMPCVQLARRYPFGDFPFYDLDRAYYPIGIDASLSF